jgi:putative SOS response-associated peptidase YedK
MHESYTMLTLNADEHPLMSRMHKPDPKLPSDQQDKRSVVSIELRDVDTWLHGSIAEANELMRVPPIEVLAASHIDGRG